MITTKAETPESIAQRIDILMNAETPKHKRDCHPEDRDWFADPA